jgi:hypothetical protein
MTMAAAPSKASKKILFIGILLAVSVYRIIFETRLWKASDSAASAAAVNISVNFGDFPSSLLTTSHLLAEWQLPAGGGAKSGTGGGNGGDSLITSPLSPPPLAQRELQLQRPWNHTNVNLYLRPDDFDFLVSNSSSSSSTSSLSALPQWVHDYVTWHAQELAKLTVSNWNQPPHKYLILRCLRYDILCAGTADRLSSLPGLLRFGYDARRLIFIHWQMPAPLHEFLVPTSINWNIPKWLLHEMGDLHNITTNPLIVVGRDGPGAIVNNTSTVVSVVKLLNADYYDWQRQDNNTEYSSYYVMRSVWKRKCVVCGLVGSCLKQTTSKRANPLTLSF